MEKVKDLESRGSNGRLSVEEQVLFGGLQRQASSLMVCPDLLDHVRREVERDATLAKNLRKAREEKDANRKAEAKAKGKKGKGQEEDP